MDDQSEFVRESEIPKTYKKFKGLQDDRYGEISILINPQTRQHLAQKNRNFVDGSDALKSIRAAKVRKDLSHPNMIKMIDYSSSRRQKLCAEEFTISEFYEFPKSDLKKVGRDPGELSHVELTHILYQQLSVGKFLEEKGLSHGMVSPEYISWDRENLESKLVFTTEQFVPISLKRVEKRRRLQRDQSAFLSPQSYPGLVRGLVNFPLDEHCEDVFALGLIVLQLGVSFPLNSLFGANEFDLPRLQNLISHFAAKFEHENSLLVSAVQLMLEPLENRRPTFAELLDTMAPYNQIRPFLELPPQPKPSPQAEPVPSRRQSDVSKLSISQGTEFSSLSPHITAIPVNSSSVSYSPLPNISQSQHIPSVPPFPSISSNQQAPSIPPFPNISSNSQISHFPAITQIPPFSPNQNISSLSQPSYQIDFAQPRMSNISLNSNISQIPSEISIFDPEIIREGLDQYFYTEEEPEPQLAPSPFYVTHIPPDPRFKW